MLYFEELQKCFELILLRSRFRSVLFLLLLSLLICIPSPASSNPAGVNPELFTGVFGTQGLPSYDDFYCGHNLKSDQLIKLSVRGVKRCTVEFIEDEIIIEGEYRIKRANIVHYWITKITHRNDAHHRNFIVLRYKEGDQLKTSVFNVLHETWQAVFWNQFNFWISEGKIIDWAGN